LLLAFLMLIFASGCSEKPAGKVLVQAPLAPATAPLLLMRQEGFSPAPGRVMDLVIYKTVEEATARILNGEADLTILPVNVAAKLYNKGVPVKLAGITTWGLLYLVTDDPRVNSLADLRGRELYVGARGATPDVITRYLLHKNGINENEVGIKYAQSPEIARMMAAGLAGTAVLPEPMVTQVLGKRPSARLAADFYEEWRRAEGGDTGLPQAALVVGGGFPDQYPRALETFENAYQKSLDQLLANPAGAAGLVEQHLGFPREVFTASLGRTRLKYSGAAGARREVEGYLARLNQFSPEMVGGKVPDENFYLVKR